MIAPSAKSFAALFAALFLILVGLYARIPEINNSSEAREYQVALDLYEGGSYVLPLRNFEIPSKPPLYHWITAALGFVRGGVTPAIARLTSVASATVVLFLTILLAAASSRALLSNSSLDREQQEQLVAISASGAALSLSTTYMFLDMAMIAMVDMVFVAVVLGAITCLLIPTLVALSPSSSELSRVREIRSPTDPLPDRLLFLFWVLIALAVLGKGPLGLVLTGVVVSAQLALLVGVRRAISILSKSKAGIAAFLLVVVSWYLLAWREGGSAFVDRQLLFENIERAVGGDRMPGGHWWLYFYTFIRSLSPWSVISLLLVWPVLKIYRSHSLPLQRESRIENIIWIGPVWFTIGFVLFTLASGKRYSYLLPIVPAISLFIGVATTYLAINGQFRAVALFGALYGFLCRGIFSAAVLVISLLGLLVSPLIFRVAGRLGTHDWELEALKVGQSYLDSQLLAVVAPLAAFVVAYIAWRCFCNTDRISQAESYYWESFWGGGFVVALICASLAVGLGVKGELKGVFKQGTELRNTLSLSRSIIALREPREEQFDTLLAAINGNSRFLSAEKLHSCADSEQLDSLIEQVSKRCLDSYFISMRSDLECVSTRLRKLAPHIQLREVATYSPRIDKFKGRTDREGVIFDCFGEGNA